MPLFASYLHKHSASITVQASELLNTYWPRNETARLSSIQISTDTLPASLVLLQGLDSTADASLEVVGYARLSPVYEDPRGVLIESVIVRESLRGQGLGKRVMQECEAHARRLGMACLYLCTKDRRAFYASLGFVDGFPVSAIKQSNQKLSLEQLQTLNSVFGGDKLQRHEKPTGASAEPAARQSEEPRASEPPSAESSAAIPLPPPPPPVSLLQVAAPSGAPSEGLIWLRKPL